jgi:hypothetical protein
MTRAPAFVTDKIREIRGIEIAAPDFTNFFLSTFVLSAMRYPLLTSMRFHRGILTHEIPVRGVPGALLVAVMMVAILGMPAARQFFLLTSTVGLVWAGALYWWHNQTRW